MEPRRDPAAQAAARQARDPAFDRRHPGEGTYARAARSAPRPRLHQGQSRARPRQEAPRQARGREEARRRARDAARGQEPLMRRLLCALLLLAPCTAVAQAPELRVVVGESTRAVPGTVLDGAAAYPLDALVALGARVSADATGAHAVLH